jgi:hypothetical protein
VDGSAIVIRSEQMSKERRVGRGDFEKLFALWHAYNCGTVSRAELGKRSRNTTYVLSILHWREETQNGARQTTPPPSPSTPVPTRPTQAEAASEDPTGHDEYGKRVLCTAAPQALIYGPTVAVDYGAGQGARIDGTVGDIAVGIESRVAKQVRGAVLDLICHPFPK